MIPIKALLFLTLAFGLAVLSACGSSATEAPEPAATTPTGAPAAAATATPAPAPVTQAAPQATATPSGSQPGTQPGTQPTEPPPPAATPTPLPEPTPTDVAQASVKPSGTLVAALTEVYPFQSAPSRVQGGLGLFIGVTVSEPLVGMNTNNEFRPKLVEKWSVSPDGLVWTFDLAQGVQFHKGYGEMTAEDVLWSIEGLASEESTNAFRSHVRRLWLNEEAGGGTTIVNDHKLEVHTGTLQYDMLNVLSRPSIVVMSKRQVEELGIDEASPNGAGPGPWEIVEHQSGQFWRMEAAEGHYRKTPYFAEMIWREIPEESTRVANFQTGQVDTFNMALDSLPAIREVPDVKFMRIPGGGTIHLGYYGNWYVGHGTPEHAEKRPGYDGSLPWVSSDPNPESEAWKTAAKVRRALSIAIDRQTIVDTLLHGEGEPLVMWAWDSQYHRLPEDIQEWEYSPDKARQLLAEAGYPDGFEVTLTPDIRGVPAEVEATEAIGTMWEEIGVRANLNKVPYATIRPSLASRTYNQINTHGTAGRSDPLDLIATVFRSTGGWTAGMDHPHVDDAIAKALSIVNEEDRYEVMIDLARFIYEHTLEAGIYTVNIIWPLSPKIDSWFEHLEYGDRRALSATEYAPHRQ
jgi:peptide/nickel transport system substrate-binding protein